MAQYGKPEYWEDRYTRDPESFDWYQRYSGVKDIITQYINRSMQILNIGCGNSRMSEEMYEEGYEHITNIDISQIVIKQMQEKYRDKCPKLKCEYFFSDDKVLTMDVKSLQFEASSFDAVVDKGTLDSILCGDNSGPNAEAMLSEVFKVLSPNGVYVCISYGIPEQRENYFKNSTLDWDFTFHKVAKPTISTSTVIGNEDKDSKNYHYVYVMKKVS